MQAAAEQAAAEQVLAVQHLPFVGAIPTVTVQVIDNGSSNFENAVTIDKGTSSGVAAGQPVVAAGGLVGSVSSVSATHRHRASCSPTRRSRWGCGWTPANVGTAQGEGRGQPMRVTVDTTSAAGAQAGQGPGRW